MELRSISDTGLCVTPIGFGAFKIGRNEKIKYPQPYDLPTEETARSVVEGVVDLGVRFIDTAPAYGLSEQRVGRFLADRPDIVVSTKVGEQFDAGRSTYAYDRESVETSLDRSRQVLGRPVLDLVFVHSDGRDLDIQRDTDVIDVLRRQRDEGRIRAIGFSGKTPAGAHHALKWADAIMVEYHAHDTSHDEAMRKAQDRRVAVIVKKGLAAGHLPAREAISFVLCHPAVTSLVIGGLNLQHMAANIEAARQVLEQ